MAREVQHDAPGELHEAHRTEVADRAQQVFLQVPEEEGPVAPLEADLVVVEERGGRALIPGGRARHHSASAGRRCLGRRRYTVRGTSTLGGLAGIGLRTFIWMGIWMGIWVGFRRCFIRQVYPAGPGSKGRAREGVD